MDDGDDLSMHSEGKVPGELKGQWAGEKKKERFRTRARRCVSEDSRCLKEGKEAESMAQQ